MIGSPKSNLPNRTVILISLIIIALFSNLIISKIVTKPEFNSQTIDSLEDKKSTVMKLAAASAATSTALTLLPGDIATPIANQMAELSKYFLLILSVILLEKMLVAVVGYVSFSYIIPLACALGVLYLFMKKEIYKDIGIKLAIFGLAIFLAIPASMKMSDLVYTTYKDSIVQTIKTTEDNKDFIEERNEDLPEEEKTVKDKIGGYFSDLSAKVSMGVSDAIKKGENSFNSFLDAISILIITTCVIPLLVILIFIWIVKILFGFEAIAPKISSIGKKA